MISSKQRQIRADVSIAGIFFLMHKYGTDTPFQYLNGVKDYSTWHMKTHSDNLWISQIVRSSRRHQCIRTFNKRPILRMERWIGQRLHRQQNIALKLKDITRCKTVTLQGIRWDFLIVFEWVPIIRKSLHSTIRKQNCNNNYYYFSLRPTAHLGLKLVIQISILNLNI